MRALLLLRVLLLELRLRYYRWKFERIKKTTIKHGKELSSLEYKVWNLIEELIEIAEGEEALPYELKERLIKLKSMKKG